MIFAVRAFRQAFINLIGRIPLAVVRVFSFEPYGSGSSLNTDR